MKTNRIETIRALVLIALPVAALLWLILWGGAVFPPEVTRDGWIGLAIAAFLVW